MLVKVGDSDAVYSRGEIGRSVVVYEEVYTKLSECHNRVRQSERDKTCHEVCEMESFSVEKCVFIDENTISMSTIRCCYDFHQIV